ncbi:alpha/beta hydrolase family protein [Flavobacterium sp.]|uniref:alpha/beta hydrolase family protein n=1 Tax=Flavobacterium sp. TaxID=239 RepID=UPI0040472385
MKFILFALLISTISTAQNTFNNIEYSNRFESSQYEKMKAIHKHLDSLSIENLTYPSFDSLKIKGYLIAPKNQSKKYPIIIFNRGGNGNFGIVNNQFILKFLSKIASKGYIVIGSQLRGSDGSEGNDEFGGKDIKDVESILNIAKTLKISDTTKIFQIGWSRGGITNFHLLKKTKSIKATVNIAGPSNLLNTNRKIMYKVYANRIRNYEKDSVFFTNKVSPIFQIDSILNKRTKFLLIHGTNDKSVNYSDSVELKTKLEESNYSPKLITIENGEHNLFEQLDHIVDSIIEWFKQI